MPALRHPYAISVSVSLIYNFESLSLYQNSKSPKHYGYRSFSNDSRAVTCNGRQKLTFIFIYVYTFVYILIYITRASGESVGWVPMLETSPSDKESDRLKYLLVKEMPSSHRRDGVVVHVSDGVCPQIPVTKA